MRIVLFLLFSFINLSSLLASEKGESFIIRSFDDYIQVIAPDKYYPDQTVVIENKTLVKLVGKLQTKDLSQVRHVAIKPGQYESLKIPNQTKSPLVFIHLSPSFQEVELKIGQEAYEIPPKR